MQTLQPLLHLGGKGLRGGDGIHEKGRSAPVIEVDGMERNAGQRLWRAGEVRMERQFRITQATHVRIG